MHSYVVAKGDSMWMIAKKFGVSLEALIKANPRIKDPNKIRVGEVLMIPLEVMDGKTVYTARSGDTLWSIAKKFGVAPDALIALNPQIENADVILIGEKIFIPQSGTTEMPLCEEQIGVNNGALYYVKKGDSLFLIAQRYALNPEILKAANPQIADADRICPGAQLYLPGFHYVKSGETLYSIARSYGVALSDLIAVNPLICDADDLSVGEKVAIPRRKNGDIALYAVRPGDTLYKIAQKYGVSVEAILMVNREVVSSDLIYPCQKLRIPGPHLVQKGQTLYGISEIYQISLAALEECNPDVDPMNLRVWQSLTIPAGKEVACRKKGDDDMGVDYVVQSGDTLSGIAAMYQISLKDLLSVNPGIKDADRVHPGMVVHIPTGYVRRVGYAVKRGDTIWRIAAKYGLTAGDIIAANPQIGDADRIIPDQILWIPIRRDGGKRSEEAEEDYRAITYPEVYEVKDGDTLYSVAARFGTNVAQLRLANESIKDRDTIYPGQQLIVLPANLVCEYRCLECPWLERGVEE